MPESTKEATLLHALLECFSASKTTIRYVIEKEREGKLVYEVPAENYVDWWPILFSKNLVALSIAPRSHDQSLSKDALSALVRKVLNDKSKSIFEKNLKPRLAGTKCCDLIVEEVDHLSHTIELGVRAFHSPYGPYQQEIPAKDLKGADEVQIFINEAIEFWEQLFLDKPFQILSQNNDWFVNCIPDLEESKTPHYSKHQVLSMIACALIIGLNITDCQQINANLANYIKNVFTQETEEKPAESKKDNSTSPTPQHPNVHPSKYINEEEEVKRKARILIAKRTNQADPENEELKDEVQRIATSWKKSREYIWKNLAEKQKIQTIVEEYLFLREVEKEIDFSPSVKP